MGAYSLGSRCENARTSRTSTPISRIAVLRRDWSTTAQPHRAWESLRRLMDKHSVRSLRTVAGLDHVHRHLNQYHVVMEVAPQFWQSPLGLNDIYMRERSGGVVPLSAITH